MKCESTSVLLGALAVAMAAAVAAVAACIMAPSAVAAGPTELSISTSHPLVSGGSRLVVRGVLREAGGQAVAGAEVHLVARPVGEAEAVVATVHTDADGAVLIRRRPWTNTSYRLEFAGDVEAGLLASTSPEATVSVRSRITMAPRGTLWAGETGELVGKVTPARPAGTQVTILIRRPTGWEPLGNAVLDAQSCYEFAWLPPRPVRRYLRAFVAADDRNAVGLTRSRRVRVHDPDPHGVPDSQARTIVIDHSEYRLYYYEKGRVVREFKCVLGAPSTPTPYGRFRIQRKRPHPGGANGAYYMGYLGIIGIHGTNQPQLLDRFPRAYSHGCTRLHNRHIAWLYRRCPIGTRVWSVH